jgi:glutamine cyclotransferase
MTVTDGQILATLKSPGPNPQGLCHDGEHLWIADRTERKIFKVLPASGQVVFSISFDGELAGTAWDGSHIWQADRTSRTISRIDPETGMIALSLHIDLTAGDVTGLHYEGGGIWYGLSRLGQARKVRETDGRFMRAIPTKSDIGGLVVVGRHLFYTEPSAGTLHKMDVQAGTILIAYHVGGRPTGLCHDGSAFWLADGQAAELRRMKF